ncbi:MAG: glycosyltransferase family 39 protein [Candidatus Endonucleobacter bathymodioli]|uniref:Glycosyltransferase family 39 protein n=1 Tax=Candidatus Endonucleibacter bathymodioli TaxID=539814 RepID=A0AA90NNS7_9GAMM|nr:glycosyltransferase family 39 protein [Candidatus Endonucleobacter bathymodioli]
MNKLIRFAGSPLFIAPAVCLISFLIRLATIGLYPLQDTSEARYGEMTRLMIETGNWITLWFDYDVPFWGKPPLFIWLSAISCKLFGINEFAARLPSLLVSMSITALAFRLALFQLGQSAGRLVLLILPTTVIFLVLSGTILAEPTMLLSITMILTAFWIGWHSENPRQVRFWQYTFFIGCAIALLAKGMAALILAGLPIFIWCLPERKLITLWQKFPWIKGTLLTLLIASPWYIAAEMQTPGFLQYFFIGEHFQRYLDNGWSGDLYGAAHVVPIGSIWLLWLASCLPWTPFLIIIAFRWVRGRIGGNSYKINSWRLFLLLWLFCPLIFFTFAKNVIWTYVLPVTPAVALLLADHWQDTWHLYQKRILATTILAPLLIIVFTVLIINGYGQKSHKQLMQIVEQQGLDNPGILFLYGTSFSSRFYSDGKAISIDSIQHLQDTLEDRSRNYFLATQDDDFSHLPDTIRSQFKEIARYEDWTLYLNNYNAL